MTPKEFARFRQINRTLCRYGIDQLLPKRFWPWPLRLLRSMVFWWRNQHKNDSAGARIRMAMEELGPVFIKFGQMMSTRRDLLPPDIADELALLQDQVSPFSGELAKQQIELALERPIDELFDDFDMQPLASASIAQVHTATLKENGQEVVLKVIRPGIEQTILSDIALMQRVAGFFALFFADGRRLRPKEVVEEYRKTIVDELDLAREASNAIQLRRNFTDAKELYVPEVYSDHCRKTLLVMERIYGIPVANIDELVAQNTNMKLLAERGVEVFFTQVFRDSFFHADMHPGNIFVSREHPEDPQYIGIDCGIVGTLNKEDQRYLAENFLAFFNRDYHKVAQLHVDSGWVPADTKVEEFEAAIRTVCEPIFAKPLSEISFGHVLLNLFNTARRFNMEVQPQLVLLQKTLLYIEGLGRQLYPELDLWATAKPFLERWMRKQVGPEAVFTTFKEKAPYWLETLPHLPELVYDNLQLAKQQQLKFQQFTAQYLQQQKQRQRSLILALAAASSLISAALLYPSLPTVSIALAISSGFVGLMSWRQLK
ncbi:ubiquinone biosynthesis regulatory protein kinase UbiB [Agarivorans sp. B2Z047]|uniref:ubiquinone biosynthesis regulatory protein kinase UbiB n=1 Tax=Agarivorans sp. B2Z047 TaxID=2652721 RepID=UPI00128E6255|nr:ubiquinone biosynthesis regulatory protein kinase UbiB [Agarivorans sp. B2Z047]MPW30405.1 ubiquinone biosynthesis regulatory protein kinase UbiB [Agarivorans sp. B2Z047]UQN42967.1 ubiquinone biosynthesis regulatory protein kinase UbiB [Agarivorans sp. B2Z047]